MRAGSSWSWVGGSRVAGGRVDVVRKPLVGHNRTMGDVSAHLISPGSLITNRASSAGLPNPRHRSARALGISACLQFCLRPQSAISGSKQIDCESPRVAKMAHVRDRSGDADSPPFPGPLRRIRMTALRCQLPLNVGLSGRPLWSHRRLSKLRHSAARFVEQPPLNRNSVTGRCR